MSIENTSTTPPEDQTSENIENAIRESAAPTPDGSVVQVKPEDLQDDSEFNSLEKMSENDLDKLLSGEKPNPKPADAPPAPTPAAGEGDPPPAATAPAGTEGQPAPAVDPKAPIATIPKPRFDEVNNKVKELEAENIKLREERAYLAGRDSKASAPPAPEVDQEAVIASNLDKLNKNFNDSMLKLAEQYDNGEMTAKEWREKEQKLKAVADTLQNKFLNELDDVRAAKSRPDPQAAHQRINSDAWLQEQTQTLRTNNPWLDLVSPKLLEVMRVDALNRLKANGVSIGADVQSTWTLRQEMAAVGKEMGLNNLKASAPAAPTTQNNPNTPTTEQGRLKLALAGQQPPMPTSAGVSAPTDALGTYTQETVVNMSDDQLAKLSTTELDALLTKFGRKVA